MPRTIRNAFLNSIDHPVGEDPRYPVRALPIDWVHPNPGQSRQAFNEQADAELADSIRDHGVLEPIIVRPTPGLNDDYTVIAGERRRRAAEQAGLTTIPAIIRDDLTDEQAAILTALENLQRQDLDIEDEARYFQTLLDLTGLTQRALAQKLGIDHIYLSRRVKLLKRPELMREYREGRVKLFDAIARVDSDQETDSVSRRNTELSSVVERAGLDGEKQNGVVPRGIQPLPWRRRAFDNSFSVFERTDWRAVPETESQDVLTRLTMLEEHISRAKQALLEKQQKASEGQSQGDKANSKER